MHIMFMKKRKSFEIFGVKFLRTIFKKIIRFGVNLIKRLTLAGLQVVIAMTNYSFGLQ